MVVLIIISTVHLPLISADLQRHGSSSSILVLQSSASTALCFRPMWFARLHQICISVGFGLSSSSSCFRPSPPLVFVIFLSDLVRCGSDRLLRHGFCSRSKLQIIFLHFKSFHFVTIRSCSCSSLVCLLRCGPLRRSGSSSS